jgi:hypothetical protein
VDGAYELYFDPSDHKHMSTIGCKIIEMQAPKFLGFQWKGPDQFVNIMNHPEPLTHVHLEFKRIGLSTEVHVVHDGWKSGSEWNDAKAWHKKAWEGVLGELEKYLDQ